MQDAFELRVETIHVQDDGSQENVRIYFLFSDRNQF